MLIVLGSSFWNVFRFRTEDVTISETAIRFNVQKSNVSSSSFFQLNQSTPPSKTSIPIVSLPLSSSPILEGSRTSILPNSSPLSSNKRLDQTENQSMSSLKTDWWEEYSHDASRVYQPWDGKQYDWCILSNVTTITTDYGSKPTQAYAGLLYVKSHKASSSTCEGINEAIAHHVAQRLFQKQSLQVQQEEQQQHDHDDDYKDSNDANQHVTKNYHSSSAVCEHHNRHDFANAKGHGNRNREKSILWTFVRHPMTRDLSQVYHFRISRAVNVTPTDEFLLQVLQNPRLKGTQTRYLLPAPMKPQPNEKKSITEHTRIPDDDDDYYALISPENVLAHAWHVSQMIKRQILEYYDFIGITERMEESLAVMTVLWDLDVTDIIVLSSKSRGGYDGGRLFSKKNLPPKCTKLISPKITPALQSYFDSDAYRRDNADLLLYYAAQKSLDRTIEQLGYDRVQQIAAIIKRLHKLAQAECLEEAFFPCSSNGTLQVEQSIKSCYIQDAGCGHACVDRIMKQSKAQAILANLPDKKKI